MKKIHKRIIGYSLVVVGFLYNIIPYFIFVWTGRLIHRIYRIPFSGWIIIVIGIVVLIKNPTDGRIKRGE